MPIFHENRRDIISKTAFDIFKLIVVALCVSGFFREFSAGMKLGIFCVGLAAFIFGFISCPPPSKKEEGD